MKKTLATVLVILLAGTASAQGAPEDVSANNGIVEFAPDSPLYGVEVALDRVTQDEATNALERAAEYQQASENGSEEGAQNALDALNTASENAPEEAQDALEKARQKVQSTPAPENVRDQQQETVDNIDQAQQRIQREIAQRGQEQEQSGEGFSLPDRVPSQASIFGR